MESGSATPSAAPSSTSSWSSTSGREGHIDGRLIYDSDLFDAATAQRIAAHWLHLAAAAASNPSATLSAIPIVTEDEEQRQLVEWNATATGGGGVAVHDLLHAQWRPRAQATAVTAGGRAVAWADVDRQADAIAGRLLACGVKPGDVVAVCAEPSVELVAGALAVLRSGAAHLLLDPELPAERLALMLAESAAAAVLLQPGLAPPVTTAETHLLALHEPGDAAAPVGAFPDVAPDAVCCVQYAASTNGQACVVAMLHGAVANMAGALAADLGLGPADTVLILPATLFHAPVVELWTALLAGARIVIAPPGAAVDGTALSRLISSEQVSFLHASPSAWEQLIDGGLKGARALRALAGGGPLSAELAEQILERTRVLWTAYGTAQTTGYCTLGRVDGGAPVTVGRPIANTRAYVVDDDDRLVPVGVTGNLLVAGAGIAGGDRNHDPSAAAFIEDPFGAGRAYRTGERARWTADGDLQLVGEPPRQDP